MVVSSNLLFFLIPFGLVFFPDWSQTDIYESILPLINMDFDGLRTEIIQMIAGEPVNVRTTSYQNDMVTFKNKDDVLTLLIHLGYLAYDEKNKTAFIPNELLRATIDMNCDIVAETIEKILVALLAYIDRNNKRK